VTLAAGENNTVQDFGYTGLATLGDFVWLDVNNDGVQDAGEPGLANVDVQLTWFGPDGTFGTADDEVQTITTDATGNYDFANLPAGDFRVDVLEATAPGNTSVTTANDTHDVNLSVAEDHNASDFGFVGGGSIGDFVFYDFNNNGAFDAGTDNPYPGVTVILTGDIDGDGVDETFVTTTDASGNYNFPGLPHADYTVTLTPPNGTSPTVDADGTGTPNTSDVTLNGANPSNADQDFGLTGTGSVGDTIFYDTNGDGTQGGGEPGIPGVTVQLDVDLDGDGNPDFATTAVTDASGNYNFPNIPEGTHTVTVISPPGANPTTNIDGVGGPDTDHTFALAAGENNTSEDFGFLGSGSIGDTVYFDANNNGVQDAGEPGLSGVAVELDVDFDQDGTPDTTLNTTTDANGNYLFSNLLAGDYDVIVTQPAGTTQTQDPDGGNDNTSFLTLGVGENNTTQDFGYRGNSSLGDTVFWDVDNSGTAFDALIDRGLPGVDVTIQIDVNGDSSPDYTETVTTDANGNYTFNNLIPGTYIVSVNPATVPGNMGINPTFDNDGGNNHTSDVTLGVSDNNTDQDFGYTGQATLGDFVWLDTNGDGVQDAGEPGLANVDVTATWFGPDGTFGTADDEAITVTTDATGNYDFANMPSGDFRVDLINATAPGNTTVTTGNDTHDVNLLVTEDHNTSDFGLLGGGSIGDFVFFDLDGNGVYDPGTESPYPGVTVTLTGDIDGDGVDETFVTTTDASGNYNFPGLPFANYDVTLTPPNGTTGTVDFDGGNDNTSNTTLNAGNLSDANQDFGLAGTGSVGDTIFYDLNGDGVQDPGENGIPGVTVQLEIDLDGDGNPDLTATTTTDQNGNYTFPNIPEGTHTVIVTQPGGSNPTSDLDGDTNPDSTHQFPLTAGENNTSEDFGFLGTGSIGDTVYFDANNNGVQDAGEPGLPGVAVSLDIDFNGDGTVDQVLNTTTDANGNYVFNNLTVGDYDVNVTQPAGTTQTDDPDGGNDNTSAHTLGAGEDNVLQDFGYRGNGSIGDTVFLDVAGDGGPFDPAVDRGLPGVDVTLEIDVNGDSVIDYTVTTTTDVNGNYTFDNLIPGDYTITVDPLTVPGNSGTNPSFDNDGGNDHTSDVTLGVDENNVDQDFGYLGAASLGDRVWIDTNGDGVQDATNEPGLANVDVTITWFGPDGTFGTPDDESFTTTTDNDGNYDFVNLPSGDYRVDVIETTAPATSNLTTGNDTHDVNLSDGEDHNDSDFGFSGTGSIGDFVFFDHNGDGIQNGDDSPYPGVTVTLVGDVDGDGVDETFVTTTDSSGNYNFPGLPEGNYDITLTSPNGTNPTFDADGTGTPNTSNVTLDTANPSNSDQDFALSGNGTVGDTIFFDIDGDGTQGPGEPGIPGVTVTIDVDLDGDGNPDFTTTAVTDQNGNYSFPNIPEGNHTITVSTPSGSDPTSDLDGDTNPDNDNTFNLPAGTTNNDQDFGFLGQGSIGDTVFWDQNNNGFQDGGEVGMPGVTVDLDIDFNSDGTVDHTLTTTTDANGQYNFGDLPAGRYTVRVTQPVGTTQTFDSDGLGTANQSIHDLGANEDNVLQDFGYRGNGSIGDTVFLDVAGDGGPFDPAVDRGLPGVDVTLEIDVNGDSVVDYTVVTTTDVNGNYSFDNLIPGDYTITVDPLTVPGNSGTNPSFDNDGGNDHTSDVTLGVDENNLDQDFGYLGAASLGDRVWLDTNGDGVQDATNEPGLANVDVTVTWFGPDGTFGTPDDESFTTTTDNDGNYDFVNLPSGDYRVDVIETTAPITSNLTTGNDTHDVNLSDGEDHNDSDFGFQGTGSVGDFVFFDFDGDGSFTPGVDGTYPGITVTLTGDVDGDGVDETFVTTTDSSGNYNFPGIPEGNYDITLTPPNGTNPTFDADGTGTPNTSNVTLDTANPSNADQDFGLAGTGSIGDTIFYDIDGDGTQNGGEPGLPGVTIQLDVDLDGDGTPDFTTTTTTDQNGNYNFPNIPEGTHTVSVIPPGGSNPTSDLDGDLTPDSDHQFPLTAGENNVDEDFGFQGTGSIGDTIYFDANANGIQDAGEPGLPNVPVTLDIDFDQNGSVDFTLNTFTDSNGNYSFDDLLVADYDVIVTQPIGTTQTDDPDGGNDNISSLTLGDGENNIVQDFGYRGNGSIGDTIFFDIDNNAAMNGTDRGEPNVDVTIEIDVNGDATPDYTRTVQTDGSGNYLFDNLIPGDYTVTVDAGDLPDAMGANPTVDADGIGTPSTTSLTLGVNENNLDQDFGYYAFPDYEIVKSDGLASAAPGDSIAYTITLQNIGTLRGQNVVVSDSFPTDVLENVTADNGGVVDSVAGTITWNFPLVGMGQTIVLTVNADVINPVDAAIDDFTNSVSVADDGFNGPDPDTSNNSSDDINTLDAFPDYAITKTNDVGGTAAIPGQNFNYFLTVSNNGDQHGTGVVVSDTLPINVIEAASVTTDDPTNVTYNPATGQLDWAVGPLNGAGGTRTLTINVTLQDPVSTIVAAFDNTASVTDDGTNGPDPDASNNSSTTTIPLDATPNYVIVKTDNLTQAAKPGDTFQYTLRVTNVGNQDGTGVVVNDTLPLDIFVANSVTTDDPANVAYDSGTGELIWNIGNLDGRGDTRTLTITVTVHQFLADPTIDTIINVATVGDDGTNGPDFRPEDNISRLETDLLVFAFDSFNDQSDDDKSVDYRGVEEEYDRVLPAFPIDTLYSGITEPGTTLRFKIYNEDGHQVGERTVVADAAGNWVANFPGTIIYKQPHRMQVDQTPPAYNQMEDSGFNLRRYFHPAVHHSLFFTERLTVQSVMRSQPDFIINTMHEANSNPLAFGWQSHSYELLTSSTNASYQ